MSVTVKWKGLELEVEGDYEPSDEGGMYEPPSGEFIVNEVWYLVDGKPERQRAIEDAFSEEIGQLAYEACENGDDT